jgi:hypothetical protein
MSNPRPTKKYAIWYHIGYEGWHFIEADEGDIMAQYAQACMLGGGYEPVVTLVYQEIILKPVE